MGWWFLLLFALIVLWGGYKLVKKLTKPVLKKSVKVELVAVINAYDEHKNKHLLVQQLSVLLRRIGISYLNRNETAGTAGIEWYKKVNQLVEKNRFSDDMIQLLSQAPYQQNPELDEPKIKALIDQTQQWVSALPREEHLCLN